MDQAFIEVSGAEFCHLSEHEVADLVKGLSLTRIADEKELSVVRTCVVESVESVYFLCLDQVQVGKPCLSVVEDVADKVSDLASEVVV